MNIYRIYQYLIKLTNEAIQWCKLQCQVLRVTQTTIEADLKRIKHRFQFPFKYQEHEIHNIDELVEIYVDEYISLRRIQIFEKVKDHFQYWSAKKLDLKQNLYKFISVLWCLLNIFIFLFRFYY